MKYILYPILLFQTFLSAEILQLPPLWEDPEYQIARCLIIENCLQEIEHITRGAPKYIKDELHWNILEIRFNMGFPIDENEIFNYLYD